MQLALFPTRPTWWTPADAALITAWHRLWTFLDSLPTMPAHYVGELGGLKARCACQACRDFERGLELSERAFDQWFGLYKPSCKTCDCWMTRAGEPAPCALLGGNVAAGDLCEGWTARSV